MGSPARRQINPIMRCWDQPHYGYAGTDDGRGTDQRLDSKRFAFRWRGVQPTVARGASFLIRRNGDETLMDPMDGQSPDAGITVGPVGFEPTTYGLKVRPKPAWKACDRPICAWLVDAG